MFGLNARRVPTLAVAIGLVAACETGTGPEDQPGFDAEGALADYEALENILQSNAMESFRALGAGISFQGVGPEAVGVWDAVGARDAPSTERGARAMAGQIASALGTAGSDPLKSPIISGFNRGKTFAYDPDLGRYAWDQDREGAPATGVRFILYEPDGQGKPDPDAEIGYADLIDEGDTSVEDIALRLVVVEGVDTLIDYRATLDVMDQSGAITVVGYLQGETDRLDFDIQVQGATGDDENTLDIGFAMGIASRDFSIAGIVSGVESDDGEGGEVDLLVTHGSDSFQVDVSVSDDLIDGIVNLNGSLFATITGDPDDPTITGADGDPLTWAEVLVLRQILDSSEDVFDLWEDLMDPVDELVILALIL